MRTSPSRSDVIGPVGETSRSFARLAFVVLMSATFWGGTLWIVDLMLRMAALKIPE